MTARQSAAQPQAFKHYQMGSAILAGIRKGAGAGYLAKAGIDQ
jgi:hypothetical protein